MFFYTLLFILLFFLQKKYIIDFHTFFGEKSLGLFQVFYIFFGICFGISIGFLFYNIFIFFIKQYFNKTIINKPNLKKDDDYYNISNPF